MAGNTHKHRCAARACSRNVPTEMLMCKHHWRMVPRELQNRIWRLYREGMHLVGDERYTQAVRDAVEAVALAEGRRPSVKRDEPLPSTVNDMSDSDPRAYPDFDG